jgi:hypothetical protein
MIPRKPGSRRCGDRLDEQLETALFGRRRFSEVDNDWFPVPLKACCEAHHLGVVERDIFATRNSLKSQSARKLKDAMRRTKDAAVFLHSSSSIVM